MRQESISVRVCAAAAAVAAAGGGAPAAPAAGGDKLANAPALDDDVRTR